MLDTPCIMKMAAQEIALIRLTVPTSEIQKVMGPGIGEWIAAAGHKVGQDLRECYIAGPESGPNPANWCTELIRQLTA